MASVSDSFSLIICTMAKPESPSNAEFVQLIARIKNGDEQAAAELVRHFEPEVRRFIRFRLSSPALRRTFDSLDICQSVLFKFFVEISAGRIELHEPGQLAALLVTMARNKLTDRVREAHADRRDARRVALGGDEQLQSIPNFAESPSEALIAREVLAAIDERLDDGERYLVQQRMQGRAWDDLASELGSSSDAIRKRMTRALDTAANALGFRETSL
jgi:RNA polymerase sigma-70 factor (ECF subfamily)